jgi:hypothetical protein
MESSPVASAGDVATPSLIRDSRPSLNCSCIVHDTAQLGAHLQHPREEI